MMKTKLNRIVVIGFMPIFIFGFSVLAHAQGIKIAFVDVAKVFDEFEKTKDNDRILQEAGRSKEEERDALVHEVRNLKDEILLLSEVAREKKQKKLKKKILELQEFDRSAKRGLSEQRSIVVREIFKDIDDTVQRYGERKAIDIVFNERALLYHDDKYDITDDILKELNRSYKKKR